LSHPLTALALILAALVVTALVVWLARRPNRLSRAAP